MILVTGISGVGKTYTIERFVELSPNYLYGRASKVLAELGRPTTNLSREMLVENQVALQETIHEMALRHGDQLILDGHAVLEDTNSSTLEVAALFPDIPIAAIVLIYDDPSVLQARRRSKGRSHSEYEIRHLQALERKTSEEWASSIDARFHLVKSGHLADFETALTSR
ncbi:AAA family ATPase [Rhizobium leguminosarum]|uniref:AAA family ATPase n=1 Tax=Rhizobium leguminosarum TaxID=384 RepID=UPI0013E2E262|nr:AAA family ATPase [Rhizobium leguminosarum]